MRVTQTRTFLVPGEADPGTDIRVVLQEIGVALDQHRTLRVHIHGIIAVAQQPSVSTAQEKSNEGQRKTGPAAGSRKRSARRKRSADRSRPTGTSSRIGGDVLRVAYEGQVLSLSQAYPTLKTFSDDDGTWLLAKSSIITGLEREATFLVAVPHRSGPGPRAWGFWTSAGEPSKWIGPRHTNFQDGSICAFAPDDRAWLEGGDLRTLLDLYSVWALRHLHLEILGRWPGKQYGLSGAEPRVQAYYRQKECKDEELCGCGSEARRYLACCKASDLQWGLIETASAFLRHVPGGFSTRQPPTSVVDFVEGRSAVPSMGSLHFHRPHRHSVARP